MKIEETGGDGDQSYTDSNSMRSREREGTILCKESSGEDKQWE